MSYVSETIGQSQPQPPDGGLTKTLVWMAHCINLPFLPMGRNMQINAEFMPMLDRFEHAVKAGDKEATIQIYNQFQGKVQEKFGSASNIPTEVVKFCILSKDLLDLYQMVLKGQRNDDVLGGTGSIRRILKYSIELGAPPKTLDLLVDYYVNTAWFSNIPQPEEWLKLALECAMISDNEEVGRIILDRLQAEGGLSDEEKSELIDHAHEYRSQVSSSWL